MPLESSIGKELLSMLLDRYEGSVFFKTGRMPSRRIKLRLYDAGLSDYPRYHIEDAESRRDINRAVLELAERSLVSFRWMKGEEGHLIAQVSLNTGSADTDTTDTLAAAYSFLGRKPKNTLAAEIGLEITELLAAVKSPWIRRFLEDCQETLAHRRAPPARLPAENGERDQLFRALRFIDEQAEKAEVLERVFSIRCFGNSKIFEASVRKRLLDIIRRYSGCEEDCTDEELLAFSGIVRYPESFEFRGPLSIHFDSGADADDAVEKVDFSPLRYGASLSSPDFKRGRLKIPPHLVRLLSIENKANYVSYIRQNPGSAELVVYHGGQFSPSRGAFFRALAQAMPEASSWYHWGDIDYGGFSMLARLRREIRKDVQAYRMDEKELAKYATLTLPVTKTYADKLRTLTLVKELSNCFPCITYMIANRVKLEQEVLLDEDAVGRPPAALTL